MKYRSFFVALSAFVLLTLLGFVETKTTYAGTNGQQISIETGNGTPSRIVITGTNQRGQRVTFDSSRGGLSQTYIGGSFWDIRIPNWWWKGNVSVVLYYQSWNASRRAYETKQKSVTCNVPTFYIWSNYYECYYGMLK